MTVQSETSKISYAGDGSTTIFSTSFIFTNNEDVKVLLVSASGAETAQTETTHYTLSGGSGANGNVTMITAPASGESLVIYRDPPITQLTDYVENDSFPAESHEAALDKLTQIAQRQSEINTRAVSLSEGSSGVSAALPDPIGNNLLGWNADGDALENFPANEFIDNDVQSIYFYDSSAPVGEKYYRFLQDSGNFRLIAYDDSKTFVSDILVLNRTGTTVNNLTVSVPTIMSTSVGDALTINQASANKGLVINVTSTKQSRAGTGLDITASGTEDLIWLDARGISNKEDIERWDSEGSHVVGWDVILGTDTRLQQKGSSQNLSSIGCYLFNSGAGTPVRPEYKLYRSRNATPGGSTAVAENDMLGALSFFGDDGTDPYTVAASGNAPSTRAKAAEILGVVDGAVSVADYGAGTAPVMPGRLEFRTTSPTATYDATFLTLQSTTRLTIDSGGDIFTDNFRLLQSGVMEIKDGVTAPTGSTSGYAALYIDTADGDLKIRFDDDTIKTIVTDS
jgi:hypothetical protein